MGLFSQRNSSVSTSGGRRLRNAAERFGLESLESRELLSLMIDLRIAGGGKSATVSAVDQVVKMEVWAVLNGSNATNDEALSGIMGSFLSTNGGAAKGNLSASRLSLFKAPGSSDGQLVDLDGDGDTDVGSSNDANSDGFFVARAAGTHSDETASGDTQSFKIGTVEFKVTQLLTGAETKINFRPRNSEFAAVWAEDGAPMTAAMSSFSAGSPVVLKRSGSTGGGGGEIDASVSSGVLTVRGTSGNNNIKLTLSGSNLVANVDGKTKSFAASSVSKIKLFGLDGNDVITVGSGVKATRLEGGNGNDSLVGGSFNDTLFAGAGRDTLKGGAGNDYLEGGTQADTIMGGSGKDVASYFYRTNAVNVSLDERANDGESGEGDNVRYDIEDIYGGAGNDILRGNDGGNLLRGYDGRDSLYGGKGNDSLTGGNGSDKLYGEDGDDRLFAKDNTTDSLFGGLGKDRAEVDKADIRKDIESVLT